MRFVFHIKTFSHYVVPFFNLYFQPLIRITGIRIQKVKYNDKFLWEIFLQENGNRFPLSKMGSGLKTIILVLLNLLVVPKLKQYDNKKIIFAFEELENNLHPSLQRRLFDYLYDYSIKNIGTIIFLTTHSHVAINAFTDKEKATLYHVKKENNVSSLIMIEDYISKCNILEDLDVRASDLLQSNGIIWVEGPSDRIYIKKWLELYDNSLIEGKDYQFLYYGGRLLSHYTSDPDDKKLISILTTNRHSAIVIDSDKRNKSAKINATKQRIKSEFNRLNSFCWITKGKEIENYIKSDDLQKAFDKKLHKKTLKQCGIYELFPDYIHLLCKNFASEKVSFATNLINHMSSSNSLEILDLKEQISKLSEIIKSWNSR